jgi:hypothetical protein
MIADFLMKKREVSWAMKVIARMPEKQKEEQYMLLQRIGKIREAIDLAADRKDLDALQDIQETLLDSTLIAYCNEKIGVLSRKRWFIYLHWIYFIFWIFIRRTNDWVWLKQEKMMEKEDIEMRIFEGIQMNLMASSMDWRYFLIYFFCFLFISVDILWF